MHRGNAMLSSKILLTIWTQKFYWKFYSMEQFRREERMETHLWAGRGGTSGGASAFSGFSGAVFSTSLSIKQNTIKVGLSWARKTSVFYESIWNLSTALKKNHFNFFIFISFLILWNSPLCENDITSLNAFVSLNLLSSLTGILGWGGGYSLSKVYSKHPNSAHLHLKIL